MYICYPSIGRIDVERGWRSQKLPRIKKIFDSIDLMYIRFDVKPYIFNIKEQMYK